MNPAAHDLPVVLVTGSSGLIGSSVCRALDKDYRVVGLDRDPPRSGVPERWFECDLTDDSSVERTLGILREDFGPALASVVHLAAFYDFSGEPSPLYDELTVQGTKRLLEGLQEFRVEQFLFSSSLLVMKPVERGAILDEDSPVEARWEYPRSKLDAEEVVRLHRKGIPAAILRIAGVYDEDCRSVPIAQQMRRIFEEKLESFFFPGRLEHGQSFVHLEDLVHALRAAIERRAELDEHEVFLIGEPDVVSYGSLQAILGEAIHGTAWPTVRIPAPVAKAGAWLKEKAPGKEPFIKPWMVDLADAHRPVSVRRAEERLGWRPRRRLRRSLPEMARRLIQDPETWYARNDIEPPDDLEALRHKAAAEAARHG